MADLDREDLIDYLIGDDEGVNNEGVQVPFTEDDREVLENFDDNKLQSLAAPFALAAVENEEDDDEESDVQNMGGKGCGPKGYSKKKNMKKKKKTSVDMDEGEEEGTNNQRMSMEDWMKVAPPEVQNVVRNAIVTENQRRDQLVAKIKEAPNNSFTENQLKEMSMDTLVGIASMIPARREDPLLNFAGAQGGTSTSKKNFEPLGLPTLNEYFEKYDGNEKAK